MMAEYKLDPNEIFWYSSLKEFGAWLRRRRDDDLRISQSEMARRTGLDQPRIYYIEKGERPPRNYPEAKKSH